MPRRKIERLHIDRVDAIEGGLVDGFDRRGAMRDAGIIDPDVEPAEPFDGGGGQGRDVGILGNVSVLEKSNATGRLDLADHAPAAFLVDVAHHHPRALGGEQFGDAFAEAGPRSSDDGSSVPELHASFTRAGSRRSSSG